MDGGRGAEPDRERDLADRRRIPSRTQRCGDVVEDLQLPVCVVSRHSRLPWGGGAGGHHTEHVFDVKAEHGAGARALLDSRSRSALRVERVPANEETTRAMARAERAP